MEAEFDKILLGFVDLNAEAEESEVPEQLAATAVAGDTNVWIIAGVSAALLAAAAFVFQKKEEQL